MRTLAQLALFALGTTAGWSAAPPAVFAGRWWRFDEATTAVTGAVLADAGPGAVHLRLGRGAAIVPGVVGGALRPGPAGGEPAASCACPAGGGLPATGWTLAFWLWLDRDADAEGVVLETGVGGRGGGLVQCVSVMPRENAVVFTAPAVDPGPAAVGRRVEFGRPDGPPHGVALIQTVTLAIGGAPWPRAGWLPVRLVYDGEAGQLRLLLDGKVRAVAAIRLEALPPGPGFWSVGSDGRGARPLRGAVDEVWMGRDGEAVPEPQGPSPR